MAYIRTKKVKGHEYAYIVESRRVRGKIKQKPKKYLGRVYRFDRSGVMDFYEYHDVGDLGEYLADRGKEEVILDLVKLELLNHGFEKEKGIWQHGEVYFDDKRMKVENSKGNPVALALNEGYLTGHALAKLLCFTAECEEDGYGFAKMFVESGIAIPSDVFVGIFAKVYK